MTYVLLFVRIFCYTLGVPVVCGLAVWVCDKCFHCLMGKGFGRNVIIATSIIGTPIHETGHALMCLLFGHKIDDIALWRPFNDDGNLGYVTHRFNPKNLYQRLGNIFIGLGPVFSGLGVILLCLLIAFPEAIFGYAENAISIVSDGDGIAPLLSEAFEMILAVIDEWNNSRLPLWGQIVALVIMLCVSLHIKLSVADITGSLNGLPVFLGLTLVVTVIVSLLGDQAMSVTVDALRWFSAVAFALFMPVFICAAIWLVFGLLVFLIRQALHLK